MEPCSPPLSTTPATSIAVPYLDGGPLGTPVGVANLTAGQASNLKIGNTAIGVLKCPDDNTAQVNQGNLSYVVNGGFALWHANPVGWVRFKRGRRCDSLGREHLVNSATCNQPSRHDWRHAEAGRDVPAVNVAARRHNADSLERQFRRSSSISDGTSNTILLSENVLAGVSTGTQYSLQYQTNWACPLPTFCMFIGPTKICGTPTATTGLNCTVSAAFLSSQWATPTGRAGPTPTMSATYDNINGGGSLTIEGCYPFSNSSHPAG